METSRCGKFVRILMFVSNFIIWIGSIVLLVLGLMVILEKPYLEQLLGYNVYASPAYILIIVGCITFLVSFLGCFGALKEIKCMLLLYFIIFLLLFIVLLIGGILGYVFKGKAETSVMQAMTQTMKEYMPESERPFTKAWDETQVAMKCCGIRKPSDWATYNKNFVVSGVQVPSSCCRVSDESKKPFACESNPTESNSYEAGCYIKATKFVESNALIIGGVGITVAILMLFGLIFSMILFKLIK